MWLIWNSRLPMVLYALWCGSPLQQELGVSFGPSLVLPMEASPGFGASLRGNHYLERLWRVALCRSFIVTPHR